VDLNEQLQNEIILRKEHAEVLNKINY